MRESVRPTAKKPEAKKENKASDTRASEFSHLEKTPADRILFLQRTIGNQAVGRLLRSGALQAKLKIGQPGDVYEQEADRVAEQVMRMPEPHAVSGNTPRIQRACSACEKDELRREPVKEEEEELKRKEASGQTPLVTSEVENSINSMQGGGQALPESIRSFMEPRFNTELSSVRIHRDSHAHNLARSVNANAFTVGQDIIFGAGQYTPDTGRGLNLIAHELTHVVQQREGISTLQGAHIHYNNYNHLTSLSATQIQRQPASIEMPPLATMRASLHQFVFEAIRPTKFQSSHKEPQALGMVLRRLVGGAYRVQLAAQLYDALKPKITPDPEQLESFPPIFVDISYMVELVKALEDRGYQVQLSKEQKEYLKLGPAAMRAWRDVGGLPTWYTRDLFITMIASNAALLRQYQAAMQRAGIRPLSGEPSTEEMRAVANTIALALDPAAQVVEAIRTDHNLINHTVYKKLWPPQPTAATSGGTIITPQSSSAGAIALAGRAPDLNTVAGLLTFITTQPELAKEAVHPDPAIGAAARRQVLDRFVGYLGWKPVTTQRGDQPLSDKPSPYNVAPLPARLYSNPPVEPPLFDVSTRGEYGFTMAVEYPSMWAAWGYKNFVFERIQVPKNEVVGASKRIEELPGEEASHWTMLKTRLAKDADYNEADLRRYYGNLRVNLGPFGVATDPFTINAAMRYAGSFIRTIFQAVGDRPWVARMNFPKEGVWVVRATATWPRETRAAVVRPPSVALLPLFARAPEVLAEMRLQQELEKREAYQKRLTEISEKLKKGVDQSELIEEQSRLSAEIGGAYELLNFQKRNLKSELTKQGLTQADKEKLQDRIDQINVILTRREKLGLKANERRLPTVFVTDVGDVLHLLIEAKHLNPGESGKQSWLIVDSTTQKGKTATVKDSEEESAIRKGVKGLLEQGGYGRGNASVSYEKQVFAIRVEASGSALLKEALGNAALLLSLAAVAAAPFTGGKSLVLLIPAGVIGAVPSAMNIVDRGIDKTLKLDLDTGQDIVNIVGAFIFLGAEAQAAKLATRPFTGGSLLITGIGLGTGGTGMILMGAKLMEDIKALEKLPAELRTAALMEVIGNAMLTAGIMIGGILVARGRAAGEKGIAGVKTDVASWWERLNKETQAELDKPANASIKRAYIKMNPRVRELLTTCSSFCVPMHPPPTDAQQLIIDKLADKLSPSDQRWFKGLLHENAGADLGKLLKQLEKVPESNLGSMIHSLGDPANAVLVSFSEKVKGFTDPTKNTPEQQALRNQASKVANAGKISIDYIGKVLDNVRQTTGGNPMKMLQYLEELGNHKVAGWDKVLEDLAGSRNFHKGATWVMKYLTESGLWSKIEAFEVEAEPAGRRWDCKIAGERYQFKSWSRFYEATFKRQILQDNRWSNGFRDFIVKWVFDDGLGTRKEIQTMMENAINEAVKAGEAGFSPDMVKSIKDVLPKIIEVGPVKQSP